MRMASVDKEGGREKGKNNARYPIWKKGTTRTGGGMCSSQSGCSVDTRGNRRQAEEPKLSRGKKGRRKKRGKNSAQRESTQKSTSIHHGINYQWRRDKWLKMAKTSDHAEVGSSERKKGGVERKNNKTTCAWQRFLSSSILEKIWVDEKKPSTGRGGPREERRGGIRAKQKAKH